VGMKHNGRQDIISSAVEGLLVGRLRRTATPA
jgi:hypothetical protein